MKVKTLKTIGNAFGVLWIVSLFCLIILLGIQSHIPFQLAKTLGQIVLVPFSLAWLIAFAFLYEASEKERKALKIF